MSGELSRVMRAARLKSAKKVRTPFKIEFSEGNRSCKRRFEGLSGSFCEFSIQSCEITRHERREVEQGRKGSAGMGMALKQPISGHFRAKILQRRRVNVNY